MNHFPSLSQVGPRNLRSQPRCAPSGCRCGARNWQAAFLRKLANSRSTCIASHATQGSRCDCVLRSFICESLLTVDVLLLPKAKAKTHLPAVPGRSPRGPGTLASHHDIMHSKGLTRDVIPGDILPTQQSWNTWHTQLLRLLLLYFQAALPRELDSWTLRKTTASFSERLKTPTHQPACCMYGPWLW